MLTPPLPKHVSIPPHPKFNLPRNNPPADLTIMYAVFRNSTTNFLPLYLISNGLQLYNDHLITIVRFARVHQTSGFDGATHSSLI